MNMKKNKLILFFYFLFLGRIWIRVSKILYPDRIILFRICNSSFTPESALILTKQRTLNLLGTTWFYRTAKPSLKVSTFTSKTANSAAEENTGTRGSFKWDQNDYLFSCLHSFPDRIDMKSEPVGSLEHALKFLLFKGTV